MNVIQQLAKISKEKKKMKIGKSEKSKKDLCLYI